MTSNKLPHPDYNMLVLDKLKGLQEKIIQIIYILLWNGVISSHIAKRIGESQAIIDRIRTRNWFPQKLSRAKGILGKLHLNFKEELKRR